MGQSVQHAVDGEHCQSHEALRALGLEERGVYLLDAVPVLEVLWADGCACEEEVCHLAAFLRQRRAHVNAAAGYELLEEEDVERFVERFTWMRPPRALLRRLRALFEASAPLTGDVGRRDGARRREAIVQACLRVALAASGRPFAGLQALREQERTCLQRILDTLAHRPSQQPTGGGLLARGPGLAPLHA